MNRYWLAGLAALSVGCNDIDTALVIQNAAAGDNTCKFDAKAPDILANITFDAANADALSLFLRVQNNLQAATVKFGTDQSPDNFSVPNSVTPVRFDLRWECDSNGFADDLGPLYLPQFSVTEPFCLSSDTRTFAGFDVVSASGPAIAPTEVGLAQIQPITPQLGQAFFDLFKLAAQAQACCDDAGGCDDHSLQNAPSGPGTKCGDLQHSFDLVAGPGKLLATKQSDVQKFRPFAIFDHQAYPPHTAGSAPSYPIRLRGVLEGVTGDGKTVSSTEWFQQLHICANCNGSTSCTNF